MFCHLSGHFDVPDHLLCWENMHCSVTAAVHMQESCICNALFIDLTSGRDKKYVNWEAQVYQFPCCIGLYTSSTISHCKLQIYSVKINHNIKMQECYYSRPYVLTWLPGVHICIHKVYTSYYLFIETLSLPSHMQQILWLLHPPILVRKPTV